MAHLAFGICQVFAQVFAAEPIDVELPPSQGQYQSLVFFAEKIEALVVTVLLGHGGRYFFQFPMTDGVVIDSRQKYKVPLIGLQEDFLQRL